MAAMKRLVLGAMVALIGCGDDGGGSTQKDAAIDTALSDGRLVDSPLAFLDAPAGTVPLTVKNVLNWCAVKVNGATTASTAATITVNVTPGVIPITATAASSIFKIAPNMWHLTDGDTGSGETGVVTGTGLTAESAVHATVGSTAKCVWICCPFQNGTGCEQANTDPNDCP